MPILDSKATVPPKAQKVEPITVSPEVRNAVVDSRYVPPNSLLTHVEGASWTVDYYNQVIDLDQETSDLQLNQKAVYQQYKLIRHMELKVTGELQQSQDETTRNMIITGSATLYAGCVPNNGDVFLADIGDGRVGVLTVTRTEKKSFLKGTVYGLEYMLRDYLTPQYRDDLAKKVVKDSTFVRDFIHYGQNPVLSDTEFTQVSGLNSGYKHILLQYIHDFFNIEYQTLTLPDQNNVTYDPFMVVSLLSTLDNSISNTIMKIRALNTDSSTRYKENNFWSCLVALDGDSLNLCFQKAGLVSALTFIDGPMFDGIAYSGVQDVVFPLEKTNLEVVNGQYCVNDPLVPGRLLRSQPRFNDIRRVLVNTELNGFHMASDEPVGIDALPDIHPVNKDDYYVLSKAFYDQSYEGLSKLEQLTLSAMTGEAINKTALLKLVKTCKNWNNLERFYYVPILLILIKVGLRDY